MIASIIRQAVNEIDGFTFYHNEISEMNENDSPTCPFIHLVHPVRGKDQVDGSGVSGTTYPLQIFILTDSRLSEKYSEREADVAAMIIAKDQLIKYLYEIINTAQDTSKVVTEKLSAINSSSFQEMFNEHDSNMDGVLLNIELQTEKLSC